MVGLYQDHLVTRQWFTVLREIISLWPMEMLFPGMGEGDILYLTLEEGKPESAGFRPRFRHLQAH